MAFWIDLTHSGLSVSGRSNVWDAALPQLKIANAAIATAFPPMRIGPGLLCLRRG